MGEDLGSHFSGVTSGLPLLIILPDRRKIAQCGRLQEGFEFRNDLRETDVAIRGWAPSELLISNIVSLLHVFLVLPFRNVELEAHCTALSITSSSLLLLFSLCLAL